MAQTQHATREHGNGSAPAFITREITIGGNEIEYNAAVKYRAGHVLTEKEASWLQARAVWYHNSGFAKKHKDDTTPPTQAQYDESWSKFDLGMAREVGTGQTIRERAAAAVADSLLARGETYAKGQKGAMVERILAAIDDNSAKPATVERFNAALAKLRAEAEAKRGTAVKKTSRDAASVEI